MRLKSSFCLQLIFASVLNLMSWSTGCMLRAQAPSPGTAVTVRMLDGVNSATDPAGKQYRATVTKAVAADNGVHIAQHAAATVTVTHGGSGFTAQLSSLVIDGQAVATASSSANITSAAQSAAGSAVSAMNSVLGGFGHHVNSTAASAAVAMGQRVILPPGTTLTFVLSQPPALSSASASPTPASQHATESTSPAEGPASGTEQTSGHEASVTAMEICFSNPPPNPSDLNYRTEFLSAVFEVPVDALFKNGSPTLEPAFSAYLKATYHYPNAGITCQPIWSVTDAQTAQKKIISDRDRARLKIVNTGWRFGQPPVTQGQNGFDPLTMGPSGLDLTEHRLTTYFCMLTAPGGTTMNVDMTRQNWNANMTTYVSQVFQADWDPSKVSTAYDVFIRDRYVHDLSLVNLGPSCNAQSPAMQTMQHQSAMISNKRTGKSVAVDFSDTSAQQAAATHSSAAPASPAAAPHTPASGGQFISCSTRGTQGVDIYVTGIFQTSLPIKHLPNGAKFVDQSILDHFHAYLTQQGYKFTPGNTGGCDVSPTLAAAEAAQHTRIHGGSGSCGYCGFKVVETGWKE